MMASRKTEKLCDDEIRGFLEGENESESDFCLSESEFELDSSSSGDYESSDEELSDSVSLDNSLQNISSHTPEHHFQWTKWDDNQADEDICGKPSFSGVAGICVPLASNVSPLQCFELFFSDDIVQCIVVETNRYANKCLHDTLNSGVGSNARITVWCDVCEKEVRHFIALILAMGIISKPELKLYWTRDYILQTPIFHETFSLKRFQLLLRYLHFVNDEAADSNDRLRKIRPLLEMLRTSFRKTYMPEQNISVDESLMLFKGRLLMKQYIPLKRARFGIKIFFVCESKSGYAWDFFIYTGQGEERRGGESNSEKLTSHASVTKLVLCPELIGKGYVVFMDRWFSSPMLFHELQHNGFGACGTVDLRRKEMPKELQAAKIKKGDVLCYTSGIYSAIKWRDKKDVAVLSTIHRGRICDTGKIDRKTKEVVKKPEAVIEYSANMGGVDRLDQKIKPYECLRKGVRWYRKLFFSFDGYYCCEFPYST